MTRLCIRRPNGITTDFELTGECCTIGRAADNEIVLDDSRVSRHHGQIRRTADGYEAVDLHSHNGTCVNGIRIQQATALKPGDQIGIGQHVLVWDAAVPSLAPPSPITVSIEGDYADLLSEVTSGFTRPGQVPGVEKIASAIEKEPRTLRLLFELGNALSTLYSVSEVSEKALDILLEATRAERGAIFLLDPHRSLNLATVRQRGESGPGGASVELSSTIANRILKERKGIITADAAADDRFAHGQSVVIRGLRSLACAPLLGKSGDLGILYLENNTAIGAFTHDDLSLLCAVAAQIGLAIENARFFDELKRSNEELERIVEERTAALRETQLRLFQSEKMAALSRLVAGVAHEVNNPLGALKSNLELLMVMFGRVASSPGRQKEETMLFEHLVSLGQASVAACARIVEVVKSLTSYVRLDEAEFKRADVNRSIQTVLQLVDPSVRRDIQFTVKLGELPEIPCYPALLNQAFMNLVVNACQAIKQSGEVVIETRREDPSILVSIRDSGCGIPSDVLKRIFEPGFTTKGARIGVGMGMAVVQRVIHEHRGTIEIESELNLGSVVTIRLPIEWPGEGPASSAASGKLA